MTQVRAQLLGANLGPSHLTAFLSLCAKLKDRSVSQATVGVESESFVLAGRGEANDFPNVVGVNTASDPAVRRSGGAAE